MFNTRLIAETLQERKAQAVGGGAGGSGAEAEGDVVYLLLLEQPPDGSKAEAAQPLSTWLIDKAVRLFQPAPAIAHCELLIPPEGDRAHHTNFATYLGWKAGWGGTPETQREFYFGENASRWRAVPMFARRAAHRLRSESEKHDGTSYSLLSYPFSAPPLRALAWLAPDNIKTPAHCATLSARCIRRALPEMQLANSSLWYGPTTLGLELCSEAARQRNAMHLGWPVPTSIVENGQSAPDLATLLHGTDASVKQLSNASCRRCTRDLAVSVVASGNGPVTEVLQRQLATALLRWTTRDLPLPPASTR